MTDPRYDEQFRRGYAGPPVQPPVQQNVSRREPAALGRPQHDDRVIPAPVEGEQAVGAESHVEGADADRPREIGTTRPFRRNPFAIGLLAVGILMLIVGVWLVEQAAALYTDGYTPEQQAVTQVESQLAGPVMTGGVIAIVAWLVLGAFAASARRRDA